jgi:uncharacterized protein YraI
MNRPRLAGALTIVLVIVLRAAPAQAQVLLRIDAATANVRAEPTTTSPVVTRATRGMHLSVVRADKQWIQVTVLLADGSQATGYISASLGTLVGESRSAKLQRAGHRTAVETVVVHMPASADQRTESPDTPTDQSAATAPQLAEPRPGPPAPSTGRARSIAKRRLGLGADLGGYAFGLGGSVRVLFANQVRVEGGVSRYRESADTNSASPTKISITQFAMSAFVPIHERLATSLMTVQPYAGAGVNVLRSSIAHTVDFLGEPGTNKASATNYGFQVLGGVDVRLKRLRSVSFGADLGYSSTTVTFGSLGLRVGGFSERASVHWYVR